MARAVFCASIRRETQKTAQLGGFVLQMPNTRNDQIALPMMWEQNTASLENNIYNGAQKS
ncbi:hypothetical protein KTT_50180 [Tengunoibacter tsumagoiensis]|uniref:Uncharacterized protein n=1 Tax=Tengunoibacter tsumagoiensis TaxID=2014871 RepID=A0A402A7V6_9CHLR|nr:hypothetical protein KTT_50180 [Tengunoibacter tsumagoiensis]